MNDGRKLKNKNHHNNSKTFRKINIPEKYLKNIRIHDFGNECIITYREISFKDIIEYVGKYHLTGEESLKNKSSQFNKTITDIYLKPKEETEELYRILNTLSCYTLYELKEIYPNIITFQPYLLK